MIKKNKQKYSFQNIHPERHVMVFVQPILLIIGQAYYNIGT